MSLLPIKIGIRLHLLLTGILPTHIHIHGRHGSPMMSTSSCGGRWWHALLISSRLHMIISGTTRRGSMGTHLLRLLRTPMTRISVMSSHLMGGHLLRLGRRAIHLG